MASEATSDASMAAIDSDSNPVLAACQDALNVKDRTIQKLTSERDKLLKALSEVEELNKILCNNFHLQATRRNMACTCNKPYAHLQYGPTVSYAQDARREPLSAAQAWQQKREYGAQMLSLKQQRDGYSRLFPMSTSLY